MKLALYLPNLNADIIDSLVQRLDHELGVTSVMVTHDVRGAFRVSADPPPGACLLLDDTRLSGWTLAMTGGQLRKRGVGPVYPLALTTAF